MLGAVHTRATLDRDGTVVSSDSLGRVQFWNGQHGTLEQTFSRHQGDVTCLAVSRDEQSVFASGVDTQVRECRRYCGTAVAHVVVPARRWCS